MDPKEKGKSATSDWFSFAKQHASGLVKDAKHLAKGIVANDTLAFYERRSDLHTSGLSFGDDPNNPRKVSTDISLVWVDRSDAEAFGISDLLMRAVSAGLNQYLKERELFSQVTPEGSLFVVPLFNLQRYAPGEGFKAWHADWSTADDIT